MARSGLKKVVKTVKGKKGTVRRSYWVKAQGAAGKAKKAAGGFARRHSTALKVVGGLAALAGLAYGAHRAPALMASAKMAHAGYSAAREAGGTRTQALGIAGRAGRLMNRAHGGSEWGQSVAREAKLTANNLGGLATFATAAPRAAMQRLGDRVALAGLRGGMRTPSNKPTIIRSRELMDASAALRARRPK